ncbi:hypothetical protein [Marimonas arenosa]|uniref:Uncharacterized protein n=1 Tax=Marimonas arenosa TaxID=1795305 RepID=A0AAE3WE02_9RHOB|nr:hypothetical protein [Marimonas arenosa]MDQ2090939.1 hypothetical protein [Marimonas arenosa]
MGLESAVEKLDKYFKRLEKGKAQKIKPSHVEKVIGKLEAKAALLQTEISETEKESKKQRLERKLQMVREQQERARWLAEKIGRS